MPAFTHALASVACLLTATTTRSEPAPSKPDGSKTEAAKPVVTMILPTINEADHDLKFLFDLAEDKKGYETLKESIDVFLVGLERDKNGVVELYATDDGVRAVGLLPVKTEQDFHKFLENLFDLDIKTAPPPRPDLVRQIPRETQAEAQKAKLQKDERLIFGLYDAYLKYQGGIVRIGESLDAIRHVPKETAVTRPSDAKLFVRLDGESLSPKQRSAAFEKSRTLFLKELTQGKSETDAEFKLRKSASEQQAHELDRLFSQAANAELAFSTSTEKKQSNVRGKLTAAKDTELAKSIAQITQEPNQFASISSEGTVFSLSYNLAIDEKQQELLKTVAKDGRAALQGRIEKSERRDSNQKAIDVDLVGLVFDIINDGLGERQVNGFMRTWAESEGKLTTVGGARVANGVKIVELLQKVAARQKGMVRFKIETVAGVDIHKLTFSEDSKNYPELLDSEGALYVGTAEHAAWYALGEKSLERLKSAIHEAEGSGKKDDTAVTVQAHLAPLADTLDRIMTRHRDKIDRSPKSEKDSRAQRAAKTVRDLELEKVALHAFQKGNDTISATLKGSGDSVELKAEFNEGVLRFVGEALSKFVKDNLED